ncbi:S24/S26 family peptidase [Nocardioides sp. YIM 152588]|uniref:S24/S26 family peptidase n=1 Tax=Nocardioides sp. YIM 152588 TaxID=3158259 RepID=UPI0032E51232
MRRVRDITGWILLGTVLAGWFLWLRPPALGGTTSLVVVSGTSMYPSFEPGDLLVVTERPRYDVGQVAVYDIPRGQPGEGSGARIVHRLIGGDQSAGFTTQGDNQDAADPWTPREDDIVGAVAHRLPQAGAWIGTAMQPVLIAAAGGGVGAWLGYGYRGRRQLERSVPDENGAA